MKRWGKSIKINLRKHSKYLAQNILHRIKSHNSVTTKVKIVNIYVHSLRPILQIIAISWYFPLILLSEKYMLSGCELIDTENISLPRQNMKFGGELAKGTNHKLHILSSRLIFFSINHIHIQMTCLSSLNQTEIWVYLYLYFRGKITWFKIFKIPFPKT